MMRTMVKVLVSIPDDLLERLDREAARRRMTGSALLQQAARHELGWRDTATIDAAIERGRAARAGSGSFESVDLVQRGREERDARDQGR